MGNDIDDWAGRSDRARRGRQCANRAAEGFIPPADGDRVGVGGCDEEGWLVQEQAFSRGISLPNHFRANASWQLLFNPSKKTAALEFSFFWTDNVVGAKNAVRACSAHTLASRC